MNYASDSSSSSDEMGGYGSLGYPIVSPPYFNALGGYPIAAPPFSNGLGGCPFAAPAYPNGVGGYPNMAAPYLSEGNGHSAETEEVVDESWSKRELKDECARLGLRNFNRLNKDRLIRLLNGEPSPPTYNAPQSVTPPNQNGRIVDARETSSYSIERAGQSWETEGSVDGSWTKRELKYECGRRGLRNFNRLNKYSLVRLLNEGVRPRPALANPHGGSVNAIQTSSYADSSPFSNERPLYPEENAGSVNESQPVGGGQAQMRESPAREFSPPTQENAHWAPAPLRPINESATPTNRYGRVVGASETSAYPAGGGGYGGHPTEAFTPSNEMIGHSEDNSEFVGGSSPVEAPGNKPHNNHSNTNSRGNKNNSDNTCIVCMDNEVNCTLVPCGHHCTCVNCAAAFEQCPVCRTIVDQKIKTYSA